MKRIDEFSKEIADFQKEEWEINQIAREEINQIADGFCCPLRGHSILCSQVYYFLTNPIHLTIHNPNFDSQRS